MAAPTLCTERLTLRPWRDDDYAPFAALNADPQVMRHFPAPLSRAESDAMADRLRVFMTQNDYGQWAVEVAGGAGFIGYVGLTIPRFEAAFTPCVEVGWRLAAEHWGKGYASEAARAALAHGFGPLGLAEVVSLTVPANVRSMAVMHRIGMSRSAADDFDHPLIPVGHRLRRHVLFRLDLANWRAEAGRPE